MVTEPSVVVTGIGVASAVANGFNPFGLALLANKSGIKPVTRFDASPYRCTMAGEAADEGLCFPPQTPAHELKRMDRFIHLSLAAAYEAVLCSGNTTPLPPKGILYLGVGLGGLPNMEAGVRNHINKPIRLTSPYLIPSLIPNMGAAFIARSLEWDAPLHTYASACAGGLIAIDEAIGRLRSGNADWALAGGVEAVITPITWSGFEAMRALSPTGCSRPFAQNRNGMVPGEGAAIFFLETEKRALQRGAKIYGRIFPSGSVTDARAFISPEANALQEACRLALRHAGTDIPAAVIAQASGMRSGDEAELEALALLLGNCGTPVTSIKAHIGHTFAGSGPLNIAVALFAMQQGSLPGIYGTGNDSTEGRLNLLCKTTPWQPGPALVTAFGFGGIHAATVVAPWH